MLTASSKRSGREKARVPQSHLSSAFMTVGSDGTYTQLECRRQSIFLTSPSHFQDQCEERGRCPAYHIAIWYGLLVGFTPLLGHCFLPRPVSLSQVLADLFLRMIYLRGYLLFGVLGCRPVQCIHIYIFMELGKLPVTALFFLSSDPFRLVFHPFLPTEGTFNAIFVE